MLSVLINHSRVDVINSVTLNLYPHREDASTILVDVWKSSCHLLFGLHLFSDLVSLKNNSLMIFKIQKEP